MTQKYLGKISRAVFGYGGYQDAMFGLTLQFSLDGGSSGAGTGLYVWPERADDNAGEVLKNTARILEQSKKSSVHELVGVPIEAEFDGTVLKDWRILTEVL